MAERPPPPRASPRLDVERPDRLDPFQDEPKTDPGLHAALRRHDNKLTIRSVIVAIGAVAVGTVTALIFIDNRVQAQTDAGVRVVQAEQKAIEARVTTLEKRFDRFDQKMDLMLDAQRVPDWKRPPPLDGGHK